MEKNMLSKRNHVTPWMFTAGAFDEENMKVAVAAAFVRDDRLDGIVNSQRLPGETVSMCRLEPGWERRLDLFTCRLALDAPMPQALAERFAFQYGTEMALQYGTENVYTGAYTSGGTGWVLKADLRGPDGTSADIFGNGVTAIRKEHSEKMTGTVQKLIREALLGLVSGQATSMQ